ncbi:phage scaffolding protein [Acidocella aminolytica]|uniref:Scaffolding protein n=1 Tax=Acidocella aminolytica 101 = DSM 11237 TaxID=1120923 RepID=A0A0D6PDF3_9PROT|nr:hypothetical protein [Acidocella aminolytica]GAN79785.1 hypothetical protein Aam_030_018 [Acidocella aminolytica 101 = DSM 11237]GBQ32046.1 hypothetical protein AA11237_0053 [Acidocella aminolytica 101 = DSM 11237]SHF35619.1 hypothetical protein SAMN02746095_02947 [Acidocella aminolytica 101 = DSM 11237]
MFKFGYPFGPQILRENEGGGGNGGGGSDDANRAGDPVEIDGRLREPTRYERSLRGRVSAAEQAARDAQAKAEAAVQAAQQERDAAVAKVRTDGEARLIRAELKAEAVKAGIRDLSDLASVDVSGLKLNEAGDLEGAAEFIAKLKETKAHWFAEATGAAKGTTSNTEKAPGQTKTIGAGGEGKNAREMTSEEYAAAKAALMRRRR